MLSSGLVVTVITRVAPGVTTESLALLCLIIVPSGLFKSSWYLYSNFNSCLDTNSSSSDILYLVKSGYLYSTCGMKILIWLPYLLDSPADGSVFITVSSFILSSSLLFHTQQLHYIDIVLLFYL